MAISTFPALSIVSSSSTPTPNQKRPKRSWPSGPPISISTSPSHLDPHHLQRLLYSSNSSCHRFPVLDPDGRPEPVDVGKLATAVAHSSVVVSVFCRERFLSQDGGGPVGGLSGFGFANLFERMAAAPDSDHRLVGFGRAVSDGGLTASIHDVVVMPSMRRLGIGRKIVGRIIRVLTNRGIYDISALCSEKESAMQVMPSLRRLGIGRKIVGRIIRVLTNRGIYDISALCSEKERFFFEACGFGEDSLGSTTMIYTRTVPNFSQDNTVMKPAGRMLLVVPPMRKLSNRVAVMTDDSLITSTEIF